MEDIRQQFINQASKKFDDTAFQLFEEYGYSKEDVLEMVKAGDIERTRTERTHDGTEMTIFLVRGEPLFAMTMKIENLVIKIGYLKMKGETDDIS